MSQELRNRERRNNNSRLYLNRGYNPNVCRLYNKYWYVPLFSFVLVSFFLCADTTWWLSWDPYAPPFSPADEATTSRKQLDPLPSQLSHKKEKKKEERRRTKIHNAETHIREVQSSINMIKIFVLLIFQQNYTRWLKIILYGSETCKPWLWIKEIAILLLFLLLAYYLCIHSIKCFFQQMTPASHEEMTVPTRKDYYP